MREAVLGIIFNNNRKQLLLIKRRDVAVWVLPGGGVDAPETPEEAVLREVQEETGLQVKIVRKIAIYTPINRLTRITHFFECTPISGQLTTGEETKEIAFFSINSLPKDLFPLHLDWIQDALTNAQHTIEKPITQVTYFAILKYFFKYPVKMTRYLLSRFGFPINF